MKKLNEWIEQINLIQIPAKLDEAISFTKEAINEHPQSGHLYFILGTLYDYQANPEQAWAAHVQALRLEPQSFPLPPDFNYDKAAFDEITIDCPFCGSAQKKVVRVVNMAMASLTHGLLNPLRKWTQCLACGDIYANPRPTLKAIERYATIEGKRLSQNNPDFNPLEDERLSAFLGEIHQPVENLKLLDIGASYGGTVFCALQKNIDAYGIELAPDKAGYLLPEKFKNRIAIANVTDFQSENLFDIITAFDLIEHVDNLDVFMKKTASLIKKGGYLCLSTPDFTSPQSQREGRSHALWFACEHLVYFSRVGLAQFVAPYGFEPLGSGRYSKMVKGGLEMIFRKKS